MTTRPSAGQIVHTPAGTIASNTVQAAINELDSEKQPNLGFTPENISNKVDALVTPNSTNYPSTTLLNSQILAANNFAIAMAVSL